MTQASDGFVVSVFGANDPVEGDEDYQTALAVGHTLAELGYAVANGGYGGTMAASARGARNAGGRTIGVTCTVWKARPNEYVDVIVETSSLSQRIEKLIELGRAGYVVLPGATGTLVELAYVWELMCKRQLDHRPLVCVGSFWDPLIDMMVRKRSSCKDLIATVDRPEGLEAFFPPTFREQAPDRSA